jgi:hypothetical protein
MCREGLSKHLNCIHIPPLGIYPLNKSSAVFIIWLCSAQRYLLIFMTGENIPCEERKEQCQEIVSTKSCENDHDVYVDESMLIILVDNLCFHNVFFYVFHSHSY